MSKSDGSTADYYELPAGCTELQDLISHRDLNAQLGEIFRACYRYGHVSHSDKMRDAKKIRFYAEAEIRRLEKLEQQKSGWTDETIKAASFAHGGPISSDSVYLAGEQFDDFGAPLPLEASEEFEVIEISHPSLGTLTYLDGELVHTEEPAASMADDSARMQAIGQNGNTGEHYDGAPSWDDAPEWAMWLAQDFDGEWCWFEFTPYVDSTEEAWDNDGQSKDVPRESWSLSSNFSWRNTLQARPTKEAI